MRIRDWLDKSGRSTEWLADKAGVSERTARRWAHGVTVPSPAHIRKLITLSDGAITLTDVLDTPPIKGTSGAPKRSKRAA